MFLMESKSNQNDISKFQIPNTNFDADKWQTRMTFTRISNSTEYATCRVKNYNIRDFKDTLGFWGIRRILFQDSVSGYYLRILFYVRIYSKYTLWFVLEYRDWEMIVTYSIVTGRWLLLTVSWLGDDCYLQYRDWEMIVTYSIMTGRWLLLTVSWLGDDCYLQYRDWDLN